jgi:hypothetical protein
MKGCLCERAIAKVLTDPEGIYQMAIHVRGRKTRMPEPPLHLRDIGPARWGVRGRSRPERARTAAEHSNGDTHLLDALSYPR